MGEGRALGDKNPNTVGSPKVGGEKKGIRGHDSNT